MVDPGQPAGRRADGIRQHLSARDHPGLLCVPLRHLQTALGEELANARHDSFIDERGLPGEGADGLAGEVIVGGTDAPGTDHQVSLTDSDGESPGETVEIIPHLNDVQELDTFCGELLGEEGGIRVREVAADQLTADGKYVGAHALRPFVFDSPGPGRVYRLLQSPTPTAPSSIRARGRGTLEGRDVRPGDDQILPDGALSLQRVHSDDDRTLGRIDRRVE